MKSGRMGAVWLAVVFAVFVAAVLGTGRGVVEAGAGVEGSAAVWSKENAGDAEAAGQENSTTSQLYAQAAVLMDAANGRVLLEKNGTEVLPMASTTKIMTCILTLEQGSVGEMAAVSAYGAGQPKVHLGARKGEYYKIEDLLYSLMLESHNDAAVIIAEYYGTKWAGLSADIASHSGDESKRAVLAFTEKMNEKALELGCTDTFFVTPNGLDGTLSRREDGQEVVREHATTAQDLARMMCYCIMGSVAKEEFLRITRTAAYAFTDYKKGEDDSGFVQGSHSVSCNNHNAFLQMMDGALSGKTGFTGKAGYCYVGALQREEKTFVVALLACGWPNHKTWKWHDTQILMEYGLENYELQDIYEGRQLAPVAVENGQEKQTPLLAVEEKIALLLGPSDRVEVKWTLPDCLTAPVRQGEVVGKEAFYVNGELYHSIPVTVAKTVPEITFGFCLKEVLRAAFL